jgi:hypothetical protein
MFKSNVPNPLFMPKDFCPFITSTPGTLLPCVKDKCAIWLGTGCSFVVSAKAVKFLAEREAERMLVKADVKVEDSKPASGIPGPQDA